MAEGEKSSKSRGLLMRQSTDDPRAEGWVENYFANSITRGVERVIYFSPGCKKQHHSISLCAQVFHYVLIFLSLVNEQSGKCRRGGLPLVSALVSPSKKKKNAVVIR